MNNLKNVNDLIRIGDAIAVLCRKTCHLGPFCPDTYCDEMWDKFKGVERIASEPRWIPCSERLPDGEVLCCDNHGEMMIGYVFACDDGETPYSAESEHEYMYDCVAWMPLPEPYQEEEQND